jgi:hypothetical protein
MTYQTDEKNLTIFPEYFVGVVKIAINCYNNRFLLSVFTNNLLTHLLNVTLKKLLKCHVYEFLGHPGLHHIPTMSCTFRSLTTTFWLQHLAAVNGVLFARAAWSPTSVPTISTTMPGG